MHVRRVRRRDVRLARPPELSSSSSPIISTSGSRSDDAEETSSEHSEEDEDVHRRLCRSALSPRSLRQVSSCLSLHATDISRKSEVNRSDLGRGSDSVDEHRWRLTPTQIVGGIVIYKGLLSKHVLPPPVRLCGCHSLCIYITHSEPSLGAIPLHTCQPTNSRLHNPYLRPRIRLVRSCLCHHARPSSHPRFKGQDDAQSLD